MVIERAAAVALDPGDRSDPGGWSDPGDWSDRGDVPPPAVAERPFRLRGVAWAMATDSDAAPGADEREAITVYSDYVCPFCYLGRRSLASYQETREEPLDIEWHPFDLRAGQRGPTAR